MVYTYINRSSGTGAVSVLEGDFTDLGQAYYAAAKAEAALGLWDMVEPVKISLFDSAGLDMGMSEVAPD